MRALGGRLHNWTSTQGCPSLQRAALQPRCQRRATQSLVARKGEPRSLLGPYSSTTEIRPDEPLHGIGGSRLCVSEIYM